MSSVIQEKLRGEPLLAYIERSQLRWFGHLVRMLPWEGVSDMSHREGADPGLT